MKTAFLAILVALAGCAKSTPTESIISNHVQLVDETLDYANNNMEDSADMTFMKNALKTCKTGLLSAEQSYKAEIATCEAKIDYWRLSSVSLGVALLVAIYIIFRRKRG